MTLALTLLILIHCYQSPLHLVDYFDFLNKASHTNWIWLPNSPLAVSHGLTLQDYVKLTSPMNLEKILNNYSVNIMEKRMRSEVHINEKYKSSVRLDALDSKYSEFLDSLIVHGTLLGTLTSICSE